MISRRSFGRACVLGSTAGLLSTQASLLNGQETDSKRTAELLGLPFDEYGRLMDHDRSIVPAYSELTKKRAKASIVYYDLKWRIDPHSNSFRSLRVFFDDTKFNNEQQQLAVNSIRLWQSFVFADNRQVERRASNHLRDNSQPFRGWKYNSSGLNDVRGHSGESVAMNIAIYDSTFIYDYNRDGKDDQEGHERIELHIDSFSETPSNPATGPWTVGRATINGYNKKLRIKLNTAAMGSSSQYQFRLDRLAWSETILHEVLHNLGWTHGAFGTADYTKAWMIAYHSVLFRSSLSSNPNLRLCDC